MRVRRWSIPRRRATTRVGAPIKPKQTPVFDAGGGITPTIGLRLGGSFAHGRYATRPKAPARFPEDT